MNNRLRKTTNDRKLLRDPRQVLVREAVGVVLRAPDVLGMLRDIAHNFSASFKGASGNTPEDKIFIVELGSQWGKSGSQTARILDMLNRYLLHNLNRKVDAKKMRELFKLADIKCVKAIASRDPSDGQYWARRGLKFVMQAFVALARCATHRGSNPGPALPLPALTSSPPYDPLRSKGRPTAAATPRRSRSSV